MGEMEKCNSYEPGRKTNNAVHMDLEECKQYIAHGLGRNVNNAVHALERNMNYT